MDEAVKKGADAGVKYVENTELGKRNSELSKNERDEREREREKKNNNFVQFSRYAMKEHRELIMRQPLAAYILGFFTEKMNRSNSVVCSVKVLEEITGRSRATVSRAIKLLRDEKWIQVVKIGTANAYIVNSAAFWSSSATNKRFSSFHSMVIATQTEQKESLEDMAKVKTRNMPVLSTDERAVVGDDELPPPDQLDIDLN